MSYNDTMPYEATRRVLVIACIALLTAVVAARGADIRELYESWVERATESTPGNLAHVVGVRCAAVVDCGDDGVGLVARTPLGYAAVLHRGSSRGRGLGWMALSCEAARSGRHPGASVRP